MSRILIVDDEPHIIELAKMYLERDGFEVEGVGTGKAAFEAAWNEPSRPPDYLRRLEQDVWSAQEDANDAEDIVNIMTIATVGIYALNLLDSFLFFPDFTTYTEYNLFSLFVLISCVS